ncbi:MAG: formylglycine-generating enzyme family protein, partial [Magnetococcales bacterium]|nr:formylglycine-generating enzyme family protein [Magnetococcales bacterium]
PADQRQVGQVWTEGVAGIDFVWIPGGRFKMGSPKGAPGWRSDESPLHEVILDGFWIGRTPVTWGQWVKVMGDARGLFDQSQGNHPVERVTWDDIQEFLRKYARMLGAKYEIRLPTEAEWEYAARAGSEGIFHFGNDPAQLNRYCWYAKNAKATMAVATREPNVWGIHDMLGNVWEWTSDWYAEDYYTRSPDRNPRGAPYGEGRVRRGGCWRSQVGACRVAHRNRVAVTASSNTLGFRLVRLDEPAP